MSRPAIAVLLTLLISSHGDATVVTGSDSGAPGTVRTYDGSTPLLTLLPYGTFTGGVRVAAGDVNGDGTTDVVTGAGPGAVGGHVRVFDGQTGATLQSFLAYEAFSAGIFVAAGDVNNDGYADILTGADAGAPGGHVKVFDGLTSALRMSFFAFDGFTGGVRVAAGDINGDSRDDIITGAGPGAPGGHVKVFNGETGTLSRSFFAFDGFTGGIFVAAGDVNNDGYDDIITGADAGAPGGHVKVFDGQTNAVLQSFFAFPGFSGGVRVAAGDVNNDGLADIITGAGPGAPGGHVKVFDGSTGALLHSFFAYPSVTSGVFVAGADRLVPEPTSLSLFLLGLVAMSNPRGKRQKCGSRL